jgi:hypothetical protein
MFGKAMFGIAQNLTHRFNLAGGEGLLFEPSVKPNPLHAFIGKSPSSPHLFACPDADAGRDWAQPIGTAQHPQ